MFHVKQPERDLKYEAIVVGGGHAGCEAALALARMGIGTLLITMNVDKIALMPCNPSIGGIGKGQLVKEISALGGEMGRIADRACIQARMLNSSKGPAVRALRMQTDKKLYEDEMKAALMRQEGLDVLQGTVSEYNLGGRPHHRSFPARRDKHQRRSGHPDYRHLPGCPDRSRGEELSGGKNR